MGNKLKKLVIFWIVGAFAAVFAGSLIYDDKDEMDKFPEVVHAASEKAAGEDKDKSGTSSEDLKKAADKAGEAKQRLEEEKEQLSKEVARIKLEKNNIVAYIQELDEKSTDLSEKIEQNLQEIKNVRDELDKLSLDKIDAVIRKENQYETMKKRIRYLYENGSDEYLQILLESKSLSDLYSRAEYVSKVTEYDNKMLSKYQETCESIEEMQLIMENKLDELNNRKDSLKLERKSLNKLINNKTKKLDEYNNKLGKSESELQDYAQQISDKEKEMEELLEEQRKKAAKEEAEAKRKAEEKAKKDAEAAKKDTNDNGKGNENKDSGKNDNGKDNPTASPDYTGNNSTSDYRWPLNVSGTISSYFGYRTSPTAGASSYHKGIDIAVPTGTAVVAARSGTVITASYAADAGNYVCISHGDGAYTYYMHCSSLSVKAGAKVVQGQVVALSGSTGVSTGPHLHFAIYKDGNYVNPLDYVKR